MEKLTVVFSMALIGVFLLLPNIVPAGQDREQEAREAALAWLALVDQGNYGQSWDQASALFRGAVAKKQWVAQLQGVRTPLGKVAGRAFQSAEYTKTLPGAPDGEYVVIQYRTGFRNKKEAVETVTPMLEEDGAWRVSGYYIR